MESADIKSELGAPEVLQLCRLCLISASVHPYYTFVEIKDVSHFIQALSGVEITASEDLSQKICESCHNQLKLAWNLRKRIEFTQRLWSNYRHGLDSIEPTDERPFVLEDELEFNCHSCGAQLNYGQFLEHLASEHAEHIPDCQFCDSLLNKQAAEEVKNGWDIPMSTEGIEDIESVDEPQPKPKPNPLKTKSRRKRHACPECPTSCTRKERLIKHLKREHGILKVPENTLRHCEPPEEELLANDFDLGNDQKPYACHLCERAYPSPTDLRNHLQKIHEVEEIPQPNKMVKYCCPTCDRRFRALISFDKHLLEHDPLPFKCSVCGEASATRGERRNHEIGCNLLTSLGTGYYQCLSCVQIFPTPNELKEHRKTAHSSSEMVLGHACNVCGVSFAKPQELFSHFDKHEGSLPCLNCSKKFANQGLLKKHIDKTHNSKQSLICTKCGQKLSRPDKLVEHMYTHNGFPCSVCNVLLSSRKEWQSHRREHTRGNGDKGKLR